MQKGEKERHEERKKEKLQEDNPETYIKVNKLVCEQLTVSLT